MSTRAFTQLTVLSLLVAGFALTPAFAQNSALSGKLKIRVTPKQAYVFVDGNAIRDGSQTITLSVGKHTIGVYNYGYMPQTRDTNITQSNTTTLDVSLQATGDKVSGPFGDIELKGHPRAAVLLNGTTPSYFVGHVDEFDNNWLWHQWLLVKPGSYQVTVTQKGKTIWSGPVPVKAGQRAIVNLNHNGTMATRDFKRGLTLKPQPRFDAAVATAVVPIAPVMAQLSASRTQTTCGQPASLSWKATDAVDTSINHLGPVAASGNQMVDPLQNTTYQFVAKGPGGEATQSATIDVNAQPAAMLTLSTPDVTYHKIGDKVVEQGSAVLHWSTSNGNQVTIQPLGTVSPTGSRTVEAMPGQTGAGPVSQDLKYTLTVGNDCGGTATSTATLHVNGSVDPAPPVTLASLFYPTNYPDQRHPKVGLVTSQEETLAKAAATFKDHEKYAQPNQLTVVGHADDRGPEKYNLALSERRADLVKNYLISQGIPADSIKVRADGKDHELNEQEVQKLQAQDPQTPPKWMTSKQKATWLAYNRRVDIILEPVGQESAEVFPNDAPDARLLWERPQPPLKAVESAEKGVPNEQAEAHSSGN